MVATKTHCPSCIKYGMCNGEENVNYCADYLYNPTWNARATNTEPEEKDETSISNDKVHHPNHYTQGGIECIEAIRASMTPSGFQDYCKGNVLKYIWRWRDKGGTEDLAKAQVYLTWLIDSAEEKK